MVQQAGILGTGVELLVRRTSAGITRDNGVAFTDPRVSPRCRCRKLLQLGLRRHASNSNGPPGAQGWTLAETATARTGVAELFPLGC